MGNFRWVRIFFYFRGQTCFHKNEKCALKLSTLRSAVLNLSVQQTVVAQASSLHRSVSFLQFACRVTGRGVVRASHIRSTKIKTAKTSSEESGGIFAKFFTRENFSLYGIAYTDHAVFPHLIILVFFSMQFLFSVLTLLHLMLFQVGACVRTYNHVCISL